jgi:hypothetical protein
MALYLINDEGNKGSHGGHGGHGVLTRNHSVSGLRPERRSMALRSGQGSARFREGLAGIPRALRRRFDRKITNLCRQTDVIARPSGVYQVIEDYLKSLRNVPRSPCNPTRQGGKVTSYASSWGMLGSSLWVRSRKCRLRTGCMVFK